MIPISSNVSKFRDIWSKKMDKHGRCDTIVFGEVQGRNCVFLIQNMCPAIEFYIKEEYVDSKKSPLRISRFTEKEILGKAKKVLRLQKQGQRLIIPNVLEIEKRLLGERNGRK